MGARGAVRRSAHALVGRSPGLQGFPGGAVAPSQRSRAAPMLPSWRMMARVEGLPRSTLALRAGSRARAALLAFGSPCESPPLVLPRITFIRGGSHEVLRLLSTCGAIDPSARAETRFLRSVSRRRPDPSSGFGHPLDGLLPIVPRGRREVACSAREIHPSELSCDQNGTGFPASALLRFRGGVPCARCGSVSGLHFPVEVPRGPGSTFRFSLGFSLWGLLRCPGFRFVFPCHPPARFPCARPCDRASAAPWSLAQQRSRRAVSGGQPLWVLRPCGHAGSSPRPTPSFEKISDDGGHASRERAVRQRSRVRIR